MMKGKEMMEKPNEANGKNHEKGKKKEIERTKIKKARGGGNLEDEKKKEKKEKKREQKSLVRQCNTNSRQMDFVGCVYPKYRNNHQQMITSVAQKRCHCPINRCVMAHIKERKKSCSYASFF